MKLFAIAAVAACLATSSLFIPVSSYAGNLALDPGFENGIQGWTGYPSLPVERSTEFAHGGKYSVKFPQGEAASAAWPTGRWAVAGMNSIPYAVEPGGRYRCEIYARADSSTSAPAHVGLRVSTYFYAYNKPSVDVEIPPDGSWRKVAMEFTNPDFVKYVTVSLSTRGTVWGDDFSLSMLAPAPMRPVTVTLDSPVYFARNAPVSITATIANHTANALALSLFSSASLPDSASPMAYPLRGYGKMFKAWPAAAVVIPAHGIVQRKLTMDDAGLPETGIKFDATVTGAAISASDTREIFLCDRPNWRTWYSIGAQDYMPDRYDGTWLASLRSSGGDSVREGVEPFSMNEAVPGQWTDTGFDFRSAYEARLGLKWLAADWGIINNGPSWLSENPANRRTLFDGTVLNRPSLCYFAHDDVNALMQNAEIVGRKIAACPMIFGVQVDNEIMAIDCYCKDAQRSFRAYVEREFGNIEAVNKAWGTHYASFSDVRIPPPMFTALFQDPVGMLDAPQPEKRRPARDFTWLKWREQSFIRYYRDWTAHFKKTAPDAAVTDNFMLYVSTLPRAYYQCPVDLFKFAQFFDVGGVDTGPSFDHDARYVQYQFDLVNSAWGDRPVWIPEIYYNWRTADPHAVAFDLFYGMGHRVQHTNMFTWPVLADTWGGTYADNLRKDRAEMLDNVKADIASARRVNSEVPVSSLHYVAPPTGIYWNSSVHNFALAVGQQDWMAGTDPLYDLDKIFTDLQYPVRFVDDEKLAAASPDRLRALFVSGAHSLTAREWKSLLSYAREGGLLVLNGAIGDYDERLQRYASSPCGLGHQIGISLGGWRSASTELFSDGASRLVKLGKNRKLRGFGQYAQVRIGREWATLMRDGGGQPGIVTRAYGSGRIVWSLTDIANPYANYQTSNTLFFIEGMLEAREIGRPVRVVNVETGEGARGVTVSAERRTDRETLLFVNNFGVAGDFRFFVNAPANGATICEMISGRAVVFTNDKGCAVFTQRLPAAGYAVYKVDSQPVDLSRLPVRPVLPAPAPINGRESRAATHPAPVACSLAVSKTISGAPLYWLTSPCVRAAVTLDSGGRIAYLSSAADDLNDVVPPQNVFPPDGILASPDGGIKPVLSVAGGGYPGATMLSAFTLMGREQNDDHAGVSSECRLPKENLVLDQSVWVSRADPGLTYRVDQRPLAGSARLRLLLHSNLLLGGEVKHNICFVAGDDRQSVSIPYRLGVQQARPAPMPVTWAGVVDPQSRSAILCVFRKGYSHVSFWNGMRDYNMEPSSDFENVSSASGQHGEASIYVCSRIPKLNFVAGDLAGAFDCWPEAGGQSVRVVLCGLTSARRRVTLVIVGVKNGVATELGAIGVDALPVTGVEKRLSLGGAGSGYGSYRLCVRSGSELKVLREVRGDTQFESDMSSGVDSSSLVGSGPGDETKLLLSPMRVSAESAWTLQSGTVRVRFKAGASKDIVRHGVDLVNASHSQTLGHDSNSSRLSLSIRGIAPWSPASPRIYLTLYDKDSHIFASLRTRLFGTRPGTIWRLSGIQERKPAGSSSMDSRLSPLNPYGRPCGATPS